MTSAHSFRSFLLGLPHTMLSMLSHSAHHIASPPPQPLCALLPSDGMREKHNARVYSHLCVFVRLCSACSVSCLSLRRYCHHQNRYLIRRLYEQRYEYIHTEAWFAITHPDTKGAWLAWLNCGQDIPCNVFGCVLETQKIWCFLERINGGESGRASRMLKNWSCLPLPYTEWVGGRGAHGKIWDHNTVS